MSLGVINGVNDPRYPDGHLGTKAYLPLADCANCALKTSLMAKGTCPSLIGKGFHTGGLAIIGEGPGHHEILRGEPFVGKAGQLLTALCNAAGVDRDNVAILNSTLCLPSQDPKIKETELHTAVPSCLPRLRAEIEALRPRIIVALGNAALAALTGFREVKTLRVALGCSICGETKIRPKSCPECKGYKTQPFEKVLWTTPQKISHIAGGVLSDLGEWLQLAGVKYVVPTLHPSFLLHSGAGAGGQMFGGQYAAPAVVAHIQKASRLLTRDAQFQCELKSIFSKPEDIEYFKKYVSDTSLPFAVDIETDALSPYDVKTIKCVGIGRADRVETLVLVTDTLQPGDPLVDALSKFLIDVKAPKILQNRSYDEVVFEVLWKLLVRGTIGDTLLASHALFPDEKHDLHAIGFRYTDTPPWKPAKHGNHESDEELWIYNARDARVTALAWEPMRREMVTEKVERVHDLDMKMTDVAMDMKAAGIYIDQKKLREIGEEQRLLADASLFKLRDMVGRLPSNMHTVDYGDEFNPNSPAHCAWALFDSVGPGRLVSLKQTAKGVDSTASEVLRMLVSPIATEILRYRGAKKVVGTYVEGYQKYIQSDSRIHCDWKVHGARTGRWSSSPNFQNQGIEIRPALAVPPGWVLVGADQAQLEMRIMAALAGDHTMINMLLAADESDKLNPAKDPHSLVASIAFGQIFENGDKVVRKGLRDLSKTIYYGLGYGAQSNKLVETILLDDSYQGPRPTLDMVQRVMRGILKAFPGIGGYQRKAVENARETREVRSALLGRRRLFPLGEIEATVALNFPIQSLAADIMNTGMAILHKRLYREFPTAAIVAQIHDAIYIECKEAHAEKVGKLLEECMYQEHSFVDGAPAMKFLATAKSGQNFADVS